MKTLARVIIAIWFFFISMMQMGPISRMLQSPQPSVQTIAKGLSLIALVVMVVLFISIVRPRRKGSLVAGILLAIYSANILLNIVLLGPIAHKLNSRAIIFLLSVVALNIISITGILKLNRKGITEAGRRD